MAGDSSTTSGETHPASAIVVAGDEETRVLLRGLLRLHHHRVLGEAEGESPALEMVRTLHPKILVADVNLAEGSFSDLLRESKKADPKLRVILVAPASRPHPPSPGGPSPDAVLFRPFRIRQFAEALSVPVAVSPAPPSPP
jgi:CheY-like chemotaxis protein